MKIRLADSEIRLRVTDAEFDALSSGHTIVVDVWESLSFRVLFTDAVESRVVREEDDVVIVVPRSLAHTPDGDEPLIHDFMDHTTHVLVELDLGHRPR